MFNTALCAEATLPVYEKTPLFLGVVSERNLLEPLTNQAFAEVQIKAQQGDANAQFVLGRLYREGKFVTADYEQAFSWMSKAAAQNHIKAQAFLGIMYIRGIGTPKKYVDGAALIKKAAYKGDADGQYLLGMLYVRGIGVPKSAFRAMGWFDKAYKQNHVGARGMLGYFLFHMSESAQDRARATYMMKDSCNEGDELTCNRLRDLFIRPADIK